MNGCNVKLKWANISVARIYYERGQLWGEPHGRGQSESGHIKKLQPSELQSAGSHSGWDWSWGEVSI